MTVLGASLVACEVPKCFWKLLETTNSWNPRYECYPCSFMFHFLTSWYATYQKTHCSSVLQGSMVSYHHFINTDVSQVMKNPSLLLLQYPSLSSSSGYPATMQIVWAFLQIFLLYFHWSQSCKSTFPSNKMTWKRSRNTHSKQQI